MNAALEEITRQIKEEVRVAILEQVKIIRKENSSGKLHDARLNLETLLKIPYLFK